MKGKKTQAENNCTPDDLNEIFKLRMKSVLMEYLISHKSYHKRGKHEKN